MARTSPSIGSIPPLFTEFKQYLEPYPVGDGPRLQPAVVRHTIFSLRKKRPEGDDQRVPSQQGVFSV